MKKFFLVCVLSIPTLLSAQELEIFNIRVGQGDATLILGPESDAGDRVSVLFDAGDINDRDGGHILRTVLRKRGITDELDFFILSHDDADHIGGLIAGGAHGSSFVYGFDDAPGNTGDDDSDGVSDWLGERFFSPDADEVGLDDDIFVGTFVDYGDDLMRNTIAIQKYQALVNALDDAGRIDRITVNDQDSVDNLVIDLGGGAEMICYAANGFVRDRDSRVSRVNTPNERSIAFLITFGKFDFLLGGDLIGRRSGAENAEIEFAVGQALVRDGVDVEILHVNHHGANNASEKRFLNLIKPEIAIISAGNRNSHKHPANAVLKRLVNAGVDRIIQTSWGTTRSKMPLAVRDHQAIYQGDVVVRSDGDSFEISTARRWNIAN